MRGKGKVSVDAQKSKVRMTTLQPGVERYTPGHKAGVIDAVRGYVKTHKGKRSRKVKGVTGQVESSSASRRKRGAF